MIPQKLTFTFALLLAASGCNNAESLSPELESSDTTIGQDTDDTLDTTSSKQSEKDPLESSSGQSGGEGGAPYLCLCEGVAAYVPVSATVLGVTSGMARLRIESVLGRHIVSDQDLKGEVLEAELQGKCDTSTDLVAGDSVLAFYLPSIIGRPEGDACYDSFQECYAECAALTDEISDGPERCVTGCSVAAELECGAAFPDDTDVEPAHAVALRWDDPQLAELTDPDELGMVVDDLETPATCHAALGLRTGSDHCETDSETGKTTCKEQSKTTDEPPPDAQ